MEITMALTTYRFYANRWQWWLALIATMMTMTSQQRNHGAEWLQWWESRLSPGIHDGSKFANFHTCICIFWWSACIYFMCSLYTSCIHLLINWQAATAAAVVSYSLVLNDIFRIICVVDTFRFLMFLPLLRSIQREYKSIFFIWNSLVDVKFSQNAYASYRCGFEFKFWTHACAHTHLHPHIDTCTIRSHNVYSRRMRIFDDICDAKMYNECFVSISRLCSK